MDYFWTTANPHANTWKEKKAKRGFSFPLCFAGDFSYVQFFLLKTVSFVNVQFPLCNIPFEWITFGQLPTCTQTHGKRGLKADLVSLYVLLDIFHTSSFFYSKPFLL